MPEELEVMVDSNIERREDDVVLTVRSEYVTVTLTMDKHPDAGLHMHAIIENLKDVVISLFKDSVTQTLASATPEQLAALELARLNGNEAAGRVLDRYRKGEFGEQDHHRDQHGGPPGAGQ